MFPVRNDCGDLFALAKFAGTVTDDYIDDDGLLSIFFFELLYGCLAEVVVKLVGNEVDGAAAEATTHDARSGHAAFAGNIVEEVEFFAGYFIILGETFVRLIHFLSDGLVVAYLQGTAYGQYAIVFAYYVFSTLVVLLGDLILHVFKHFPVAVA